MRILGHQEGKTLQWPKPLSSFSQDKLVKRQTLNSAWQGVLLGSVLKRLSSLIVQTDGWLTVCGPCLWGWDLQHMCEDNTEHVTVPSRPGVSLSRQWGCGCPWPLNSASASGMLGDYIHLMQMRSMQNGWLMFSSREKVQFEVGLNLGYQGKQAKVMGTEHDKPWSTLAQKQKAEREDMDLLFLSLF